MSYQYQENYSTPNKLRYEGDPVVNIKFTVTTPATLHQKGQLVTLKSTGKVDVSVAGETPIGHVFVPNDPNDPQDGTYKNDVTVRTVFSDVTKGYAKTTGVNIGQLVEADGQSAVDAEFMDFIVAAGGVYATGIALTAAAVATDEFFVGLFLTPVYVA